ncbi:MAG: signal peptidase II [Christensenella sp.]|uniref:signal peptidase II n=1 Tax=Christensenella sp. TaxID=1935934 RepID=UPI002B20A5CF|nr:signal peptidase II [Christensenella sp.]MEA5004574.1 signal peptidase II [Christensenella sp.]
MIYVLLIAAIVAGDQIVKMIVASTMTVGQSFSLIPGFVNITYVQNTGAAFSLFSNATWILAILSSVMAVIVIYILFKYKNQFKSKLFNFSMAFIAGGAIGNVIDRIAHGYVIDMLEFDFVNFAIFNVADSFVCIGAVMLGIFVIWFWDKHKKAEKINDGKS